jgi:hypothetical protein
MRPQQPRAVALLSPRASPAIASRVITSGTDDVANVKIERLTIRMRGVSVGDARRAAVNLAPSLQRALAASTEPIVPRRSVEVKAAPRGTGTVADRVATPLARALRGGGR